MIAKGSISCLLTQSDQIKCVRYCTLCMCCFVYMMLLLDTDLEKKILNVPFANNSILSSLTCPRFDDKTCLFAELSSFLALVNSFCSLLITELAIKTMVVLSKRGLSVLLCSLLTEVFGNNFGIMITRGYVYPLFLPS